MVEPAVSGVPARLGRFEVVGLLATGGMAEILLARIHGPSGFERPVVIKRILPHLARLPEFRTMFTDEARLVARIFHENVVQVHELGAEGDELFLVMEYLEGESAGGLTRRLVGRGAELEPWLGAHIVAEACAGLHAAHELDGDTGEPLGLVHRDISPQNLFVTYSGGTKVLDFGIAKAADRSTKTKTGHVKGKFQYMSPEQCLGESVDRRSDIFSLGIVLYELTTGRRLFKRDNELLTFQAICREPIVFPSKLVPSYPKALEPIVLRALARRPEDRYSTAQDMRTDLVLAMREIDDSRDPRQALAQLMSQEFSDRIGEKREMLKKVGAGGSAPKEIPVAEADEGVDIPAVTALSATLQASLRAKRRPRRMGLVAAALVALAAVVVAIAFVPRSVESDASRAAASGGGSGAEVAPLVTLEVASSPPGASVTANGQGRGKTPLALAFARGSKVRVELTLAGHDSIERELTLDANRTLDISLTRAASVASASPASGAPAPATSPRRPHAAVPPVSSKAGAEVAVPKW